MAQYLLLSVDGSGNPSYKHGSKEYCLSGNIVSPPTYSRLDTKLKKFKRRFFGDEETNLHYLEIIRKVGVFSVLKDPNTETKFWHELATIIEPSRLRLVFIMCNKGRAKNNGWAEKTISERSYSLLITNFMKIIYKEGFQGRIVTESDKFTDISLITSHNRFQSTGLPTTKITTNIYNKLLTSVSFVNKFNLDPTIQIADILAPFQRLKYRIEICKTGETTNEIQKMYFHLLDRKTSQKELIIEHLI